MILCAKFGQHQPLNRQSELYAREGVAIDTSTLADWVGAAGAVLAPLHELIRRHVQSAARLHGDVARLVSELEKWMGAERARVSRHAELAKAIDYMLKRWPAFTRLLADGRICPIPQCSRASIARSCARQESVAVRWLRSR
jgi:transposase